MALVLKIQRLLLKLNIDNTIGAPEIRKFRGVLQNNAKGLYVSTGGFTREAEYEAERSNNPITLMDIDLLVSFIIQYYDNFDSDARNLIHLKKDLLANIIRIIKITR